MSLIHMSTVGSGARLPGLRRHEINCGSIWETRLVRYERLELEWIPMWLLPSLRSRYRGEPYDIDRT